MGRFLGLLGLLGLLGMTAASGMATPVPVTAQSASPLDGVWALNRSASEFPREIGFNVNWLPTTDGTGQGAVPSSGGGGRGRRGSGGGRSPGSPFRAPESYEEGRRLQLLTAEARNPPVRLMIVDTPAAVTITNEVGQSRVLHPDGKNESVAVQGLDFPVNARREGDRLVVVYHVEQDRDVRYTYSHSDNPSQLIVEVQFLEHGSGDKARRVYEPGIETDALSSTTPVPNGGSGLPASGSPSPGTPAAGGPGSGVPAAPSKGTVPEAFDERPGAELKGIRNIGILVEELSSQATGCGLNHDAIESSLSKRLTDAGFVVRKNSDEDTYVYVNVMTTTLSNGTCASRYDAFLYTHATANLTYRDRPVLVQVSLMHRGGIGNSAPMTHAAAVMRGLESYVDLFATQIHDANK
jgi:hypothetical protein